MISYSTGLLNTFAPHIAELTECSAPDMAEYDKGSSTWIHQYIINSSFAARYPDPYFQYAMVFIRRTESAFQSYYAARSALASYITGPKEHISKYFASLQQFELLVSQIYQAYMVFEKIIANGRFWSKGDASVLEKINTLYNYIKHAEDKIFLSKSPAFSASHVWLTNSGISCEKVHVLYIELTHSLKELAENATYYCNPYIVLKDIEEGKVPT